MADDRATVLATAILEARRARGDHLAAEMFLGEHAWDMVLHLFVADGEGRPLTGAQLIARTGCGVDIGRRWTKYLTDRHYIIGDGDGHLDDMLTLTPSGLHRVEQWLEVAGRLLVPDDRALDAL